MPHMIQRTFRLDSCSENSSVEGKSSATGSKVWGNSVLSANFEAPIDNEDEDDIRKVADKNTLKRFLQDNSLQDVTRVVESHKDLVTLASLKRLNEPQIHEFFQESAPGQVSTDKVTELFNAL